MPHHPARSTTHHGGYTVTELIATITLVLLATSLVMPSLRHAGESARIVDCQVNLKLLGVAQHMYADMEKDFFPPIRRENTKYPWYTNPLFRSLMHIGPEFTGGKFPDRLLCPDRPKDKDKVSIISRSYGVNITNLPIEKEPAGEAQYLRRGDIRNPSEKVHIGDGNDWRISMNGAEYAKKWDVTHEANGSPAEKGAYQTVAFRHEETANVIRFDGSVRNYKKQELWITKADGKVDTIPTRKIWWVAGDETVLPPPKPKTPTTPGAVPAPGSPGAPATGASPNPPPVAPTPVAPPTEVKKP